MYKNPSCLTGRKSLSIIKIIMKDTLEIKNKLKIALTNRLYEFSRNEIQNTMDWTLGKHDYKQMHLNSENNLNEIIEHIFDVVTDLN